MPQTVLDTQPDETAEYIPFDRGAHEREKRAAKKRMRKIRRRVIFGVFVLLIAIICLLTAVLGGSISLAALSDAYTVITGRVLRDIPLEEGYDRVYAELNNTVITAGERGVMALSLSGTVISRQAIAIPFPAIAAGEKYAAAYSVGSVDLILAGQEGIIGRLKLPAAVMSVTIGDGDSFAVTVGEYGGYKGAAYVYKVRGGKMYEVFRWYSGTDYILSAAIDKSGSTLAVNCLSTGGSRIVIYSVADPESGRETSCSETILETSFTGGGDIVARTRNNILIITPDCKVSALYNVPDEITAYSAGDEFCVVATVTAGGENKLTAVSYSGGAFDTSIESIPKNLAVKYGRISVLTSNALTVYSGITLSDNIRIELYAEAGIKSGAMPGDVLAAAPSRRSGTLLFGERFAARV